MEQYFQLFWTPSKFPILMDVWEYNANFMNFYYTSTISKFCCCTFFIVYHKSLYQFYLDTSITKEIYTIKNASKSNIIIKYYNKE